MTQSRAETGRLTALAVLCAMALAVQYLESLLPTLVPGVPIRIGLANVFVLFALLRMRRSDAVWIALVKVLILPLVTGNVSALPYSLLGAVCSLGIMLPALPLYRRGRIGAVGLSALGAFCFNVGQLAVGCVLIGRAMLVYFPWLGVLSIPAGIATGLIAELLSRRIPKRLICSQPENTDIQQ